MAALARARPSKDEHRWVPAARGRRRALPHRCRVVAPRGRGISICGGDEEVPDRHSTSKLGEVCLVQRVAGGRDAATEEAEPLWCHSAERRARQPRRRLQRRAAWRLRPNCSKRPDELPLGEPASGQQGANVRRKARGAHLGIANGGGHALMHGFQEHRVGEL